VDRDLVIRAQGGDHAAFTALIAPSMDRLFSAAQLILRDQERAEDAVQDALIQAWVSLRGLRDPERFDAWLHRSLVRGCYRAAKQERGRRVVEIHGLTFEGPAAPDDQLGVATRDLLERGFRRLAPDERVVLVVHYYLDLTDAAAAEVLDVPLGTFKSRLHRATASLRAALEADERQPRLVEGPIT
jgi:RNA polymerase sigma factor (sigma-70 family)